jgi:UV DNA damage endonuclease
MLVPSNFRLGYACICTELRKDDIFASRTVRLATLQTKGLDYVKSLALQNLTDLLTILKWNKENGIYFMRLSSEMFPFASHLEHGYSLDFADAKLKEIGKYARDNNMRLTMHPGQYDVLSSPNETVISNTISDLTHHCDILDRMEMGVDSVMIIHGGGVYNDKNKSLKRLEENFKKLPINVQHRLVLENCEMSYCVEDLLTISESLQIPIVLDFHHDDIYNSSQPIENYFDRVFAVWHARGIKPKVHVSNSVPGISENDSKTLRRKHSDYISFLHKSLLTITFPLDVMLECKMKEQAIFQLRKTDLRQFFGLKTKK